MIYIKKILNIISNKGDEISGIFIVLSMFVFVGSFIYAIVSSISTDNSVTKASNNVIYLNNEKRYNEAILVAENIKVRFAPDKDYNYSGSDSFSNVSKLALANSYNQIGKPELARKLYLNIIGYTEEEYSALDHLHDNSKERNLEDLATFMTYTK